MNGLPNHDAVYIAPGSYVDIGVTPTLTKATPAAVERFTPQQRNCYQHGEITLE